jgi:hypothetical protein
MADPNHETKVFGLSADDRRAVQALYRAVSDHNPDSLDEAVTPDWSLTLGIWTTGSAGSIKSALLFPTRRLHDESCSHSRL